MKTALLCLLVIALVACHGRDGGGPILPAPPTPIRCFDWDGGQEFVVVERPIDPDEGKRLKLCRLSRAERLQYGKRRRCYFDCPPELRDFQEHH